MADDVRLDNAARARRQSMAERQPDKLKVWNENQRQRKQRQRRKIIYGDEASDAFGVKRRSSQCYARALSLPLPLANRREMKLSDA